MREPKDLESYTKYYDAQKFTSKIGKIAKKVGAKLVYYALTLYYALQSDGITKKERALIIGALGYLILPIDLIPDFLPGIGYTDDLAALLWAALKVVKNITPEVKSMAEARVKEIFGDIDTSEFDDVSRVQYDDPVESRVDYGTEEQQWTNEQDQ